MTQHSETILNCIVDVVEALHFQADWPVGHRNMTYIMTSMLMFTQGQSLSFSSPEFLELLPEIDESMKPIETVKVTDQLCMRTIAVFWGLPL